MTDIPGKCPFLLLFELLATLDVSPHLCMEEALKFTREVCVGEMKVMEYCIEASDEVARLVVKTMGIGG